MTAEQKSGALYPVLYGAESSSLRGNDGIVHYADQLKGFAGGASEDGTVYYRPRKHQYNIEIEQNNKEWLEEVADAVEKTYGLHTHISITSKGYYRLTVCSKLLFFILKELRSDYRKVLNASNEYQVGFVQGMFDAEGTVHNKRRQIRISSKNLSRITVVKTVLENNGIRTGKLSKDGCVFVLPFYGKENLIMFKQIFGFRHPDKRLRLQRLVSRRSL